MIRLTRNIQGRKVDLTLVEVDPYKVKLDTTNPRVGFSMRQLKAKDRSEDAANLLLTSQEDTEGLKRSILLSGGVQEPIYLRADMTVAEGNRRVVALRAALEEFPDDKRYTSMPAWKIPKGTPEEVIQDLLNEIHLGSVRGWAPYEKALQMKSLVETHGLLESEVAERYRMSGKEVKQQIASVEMMDELYFPITKDPTDPDHRSKFSYFLEFIKNGRIQSHAELAPDLPKRFSRWVRDGRIETGASVRRLPKILDSKEATRLLEVSGFDAADECVSKNDPKEHDLYALMERARNRLHGIPLDELRDLAANSDRQEILDALRAQVDDVLREARKIKNPSTRKAASKKRRRA